MSAATRTKKRFGPGMQRLILKETYVGMTSKNQETPRSENAETHFKGDLRRYDVKTAPFFTQNIVYFSPYFRIFFNNLTVE